MHTLFKKGKLKIWWLVVIVAITLPAAVLIIAVARNSDQDFSNVQFNKTEQLISTAIQRLETDKNNPDRYADLCQLYLQKVRETADTALYKKCDELLDKAIVIDPNNETVIAAQAAVAYGRHDFIAGLELSKKANKISPHTAVYYGLIGDGQLEIGKYEKATESFQTMIDTKPNLAAFNRVAYVRELYGDIDGAKQALRSAISSGSSFPENVAFSYAELAKLQARSDLDKAEQTFNQALQVQANYTPALEGLGRVAFARGDSQKAIDYFMQAFNILPLAQYAIGLGDVYTSIQEPAKAKAQYFLADLAFEDSTNSGVNNNYERALYLSQRNMEPVQAINLAAKAVETRPSIFSFDALAWAQYQNGDFKAAEQNINQALRFGEHQPMIVYHAGLIAQKLGKDIQAKNYLDQAFKIDRYFLESHFSLLDQEIARKALQELK